MGFIFGYIRISEFKVGVINYYLLFIFYFCYQKDVMYVIAHCFVILLLELGI